MEKSEFQFVNPYLEYLDFRQNSNFSPSHDSVKMENSFQIEVNKSENNEAKVTLTLQLNKELENAPFTLEIKMSSIFKWNKCIEDRIDLMLRTNAPALLLGYIRPIVANITNSSQYPAYNLPFINFLESENES